MNEIVVFTSDHSEKGLLSALVIISAVVIIIVLLLYLKRKNQGDK